MKKAAARSCAIRVALGIVTGFVLLCIAVLGLSALTNRSLPTHSEVVERLSDLDKARLAEALHLRQELGEAVWPGWSQIEIPTILYNEEYAFLVGYPDPPPGWSKVPDRTARGGPWEVVTGDDFAGQPYYRQRLPDPEVTPEAFTVLVGERWVASMMTKEWMDISLVMQTRETVPPLIRPVFPYRLVNQVFISDWYITTLSHESFHAYQGSVSPDRLADAEMAIRQWGDRYPWDDDGLRDAWQAEVDLLAQALQAASDSEAAALARQFLETRDQRRAEFDPAWVDYERQREWLEGLAKYVEMEVWRQASTTPGYEPLPALAGDPEFKGYATFEQRWVQELGQLRRATAQADSRFYYTGMAEAVLLDRLMPGWKEQAMEEGIFLEDLLRAVVGR
jgi:hypothetical protein